MALARPPQSAPSLWMMFARLRLAVRNWYITGPLIAIAMPTRVPPRRGLQGTWVGRFVTTFRMFDGSKIRCRLEDAGDLLSVYVDCDYERMNISWKDLLSIVDVELGAEYTFNRCGNFHPFLRAAGVSQTYWDIGNASSRNGNMSLFGGQLSGGISF